MDNKIRELAIEFWRDAQGTSMYPNEEGEKQISNFLLAIQQELVKMLPSEMQDCSVYRNHKLLKKDTELLKSKREGFNKCRSDMHSKIERMCK